MDEKYPIQINNSQVIIVVVPDSPAELFNGTFTGIPLINTPNGLVPYHREPLAIEAAAAPMVDPEVIEAEEVTPEPEPLRIIRDPLRRPTYSYVSPPVVESSHWDSSDYLAMGLVGGLVSIGVSIVGILAYAVYPIIAAAMAIGLDTVGAILVIGGLLYWATQLMGFWDNTVPGRAGRAIIERSADPLGRRKS